VILWAVGTVCLIAAGSQWVEYRMHSWSRDKSEAFVGMLIGLCAAAWCGGLGVWLAVR
jgi:hypothetical protein